MSAKLTIDKLDEAQKALLTSPYGFGKYYLGLPLADAAERKKVGEVRDPDTGRVYYEIHDNDVQRQIVDSLDVAPGATAKTTARTANGAGKTTMIIPTAILWFMALHPRAKVVVTSGVERQVRAQIFPALKSRESRLAGWQFTDTTVAAPNGSVCIGFATNQGGRFEGWHGNKNPFYDLLKHDDGPLLIVIDEAKSVAQQIFDAVDRCTYQALLYTSSCGGSTGEFYKSHTANARFFRRFHLPASLCPHADHAKNLELILKRGIDDPLVRSKVFAEFMAGVEGAVVKAEWLTAIRANPPAEMDGSERVFCDFAAGGDENVIAYRRGNRVRIVAAWREKDTMRACGQFIDHFRRMQITPERCRQIVAGDGDGLGKVMLDRLAELGWQIERVHNGSAAREKHYANRAAEMWYEGAKKLENGRVILDGPADDVLDAQLTERRGFTDSAGRLHVEPKDEMKARGLDSPDRADALFGAIDDPAPCHPIPFAGQADDRLGLLAQLTEMNGLAADLPGAFAG